MHTFVYLFNSILPDICQIFLFILVALFNKWVVGYYAILLYFLLIPQIRVNDLKLFCAVQLECCHTFS